MHIGVIRPRIRVRNEISRFLSSGSTPRDRCWLFWIRARIRELLINNSCSEHISDPKEPNGNFMNSTPPFWDLSRESWGARSEPLHVPEIISTRLSLADLCIQFARYHRRRYCHLHARHSLSPYCPHHLESRTVNSLS